MLFSLKCQKSMFQKKIAKKCFPLNTKKSMIQKKTKFEFFSKPPKIKICKIFENPNNQTPFFFALESQGKIPKHWKFSKILKKSTCTTPYVYPLQTGLSKKSPEIAVTAIDKKLLKFWSANFEKQKS